MDRSQSTRINQQQQDFSLYQEQVQTNRPIHYLALSPQTQPQTPTVQSPRKRRIPNWRDGVAGAIAGAASKTAMAPIERVKLLLQLQGSANVSPKERLSAFQAATQIYNQEGLLSFWRGNWPNVMRTAGQAALNLALMDYYKSIATSYANFDQSHPSFLQPKPTEDELYWQRRRKLVISFVSGGLAGGSATTLLYPTEFLRTRLAMDLGRSKKNGNGTASTRQYKGMSDVIVQTFKTDGIRGLYQGYGIALWGSVLYRFLFLGGYDAIKNEMEHYKRDRNEPNPTSMSMVERFMLAQTVAITAGTICYPIDSVRRRLMMQAGTPMAERKYNGSLHCFRVVLAQEGVGGFYLGIGPNLVRSIGGALMLVAYDVIKNNL